MKGQRPRSRVVLALLGGACAAGLAIGLALGVFRDEGGTKVAGDTALPASVPKRVVKPIGRTILVLPEKSRARGDARGRVGVSAKAQERAGFVPGQLLVKFKDGTSQAAQTRLVGRVDGEIDDSVGRIDVGVVDVPSERTNDALRQLEASPAVEYVERDAAVTAFGAPNDPLWPNQWGPAAAQFPDAWGTGSANVLVAVLDTGVDRGHPELQGVVVPGRNVVDPSADTIDRNGHGTASAGVIAARINNRSGQAGVCGVCTILPVKVLNDDNRGTTSDLAAGIIWAADAGARVISMSLGGFAPTQTLTDAITYAAGKGVVLVGAAGNNGSTAPVYPAAYSPVLSVAGTTADNGLYSWSSYGSWVKVSAPGCNVATWVNGGFVNFCGTSSATPLVAGLAALALSARPAAGAAEIEQAIERAATPLPGEIVEYGLVNAQRTLTALGVKSRSGPAARP
jgi:thermitase